MSVDRPLSPRGASVMEVMRITDADRDEARARQWHELSQPLQRFLIRLAGVGPQAPFSPAKIPDWSAFNPEEKRRLISKSTLLRRWAEELEGWR